jgi:hypothetical protein
VGGLVQHNSTARGVNSGKFIFEQPSDQLTQSTMSNKKDKKDKHKASDNKDAGTLYVSSKFECRNCGAVQETLGNGKY